MYKSFDLSKGKCLLYVDVYVTWLAGKFSESVRKYIINLLSVIAKAHISTNLHYRHKNVQLQNKTDHSYIIKEVI